MPALSTTRTRNDQVEAFALGGFTTLRNGDFIFPCPFHHDRQPINHDVKKTADQGAKDHGGGKEQPPLLRQEFQQEAVRLYNSAELEDRQIHGHDDSADNRSKKHDHDGFDERGQRRNRIIDFTFVKVRYF